MKSTLTDTRPETAQTVGAVDHVTEAVLAVKEAIENLDIDIPAGFPVSGSEDGTAQIKAMIVNLLASGQLRLTSDEWGTRLLNPNGEVVVNLSSWGDIVSNLHAWRNDSDPATALYNKKNAEDTSDERLHLDKYTTALRYGGQDRVMAEANQTQLLGQYDPSGGWGQILSKVIVRDTDALLGFSSKGGSDNIGFTAHKSSAAENAYEIIIKGWNKNTVFSSAEHATDVRHGGRVILTGGNANSNNDTGKYPFVGLGYGIEDGTSSEGWNIEYPVVRGGKDYSNAAHYTELLMQGQPFLQVGYGDMEAGWEPSDPEEVTPSDGKTGYFFLWNQYGRPLVKIGNKNGLNQPIEVFDTKGTRIAYIHPEGTSTNERVDFQTGVRTTSLDVTGTARVNGVTLLPQKFTTSAVGFFADTERQHIYWEATLPYSSTALLDNANFIRARVRIGTTAQGWSFVTSDMYYTAPEGSLKISGTLPLPPSGESVDYTQGSVELLVS